MSDAPPASDPEALRDDRRQVRLLRVPAAGGCLDVREPRAVLDVKQGPEVEIPRQDIGATGELVVLIRLVNGNREAGSSKSRSLELAHSGVHEIPVTRRLLSVAQPRICEVYLQAKIQRARERRVRLQRHPPARFDRVHSFPGYSGPRGDGRL